MARINFLPYQIKVNVLKFKSWSGAFTMLQNDAIAGSKAGLLATAGAICTGLSFMHEYAFFYVVDIRFMSLISPSDYIRLVINWLPITALMLAVGYLIEFSRESVRSGLKREAIQDGKKSSILIVYTMDASLIFPVLMMIAFVILALLDGFFVPAQITLTVGGMCVSLIILVLIQSVASPKVLTILRLICLVTPFVTAAVGTGLDNAYAALSATNSNISLEGSNAADDAMVLLRLLEKGVLVRNISQNTIHFLPWDNVKRVSSLSMGPFLPN